MKRVEMIRGAAVLLVVAMLVSGAAAARLAGPTVVSESTARLLDAADKGTVASLEEPSVYGPPVVGAVVRLAGTMGAESAAWFLSVAGLLLVCALASVVMFAVAGFWSALLGPTILFLHPQVMQLLFEPSAGGLALFFLLSPALLFALAGAVRGGRLPWAVLLSVAGGGLAGVSVLAHHVGLWAAVGALLGLAVAVPRDSSNDSPGMLRPAAVGLELAAALVTFVAAVAVGAVVAGAGKDKLVGWLFGPFGAFHPPMMVAGTVYSEAVDGGPPLWASAFLLLVRTPILLSVMAVAGAVLLPRRGIPLLSGPLAPVMLTWAALLVCASLAGSPLFFPGLSLLAPLSLVPCLLAAGATAGPGALPGRNRAAALAVGIILVGSTAGSGLHPVPYPAAFGSLLCGGTQRCNAGNDPWMEPALDSALMEAVVSGEKELVVTPWGSRIQGIARRLVPEGTVRIKEGGPWRTLVWRPARSPAASLLLQLCVPDDGGADLPPGTARLWSICR